MRDPIRGSTFVLHIRSNAAIVTTASLASRTTTLFWRGIYRQFGSFLSALLLLGSELIMGDNESLHPIRRVARFLDSWLIFKNGKAFVAQLVSIGLFASLLYVAAGFLPESVRLLLARAANPQNPRVFLVIQVLAFVCALIYGLQLWNLERRLYIFGHQRIARTILTWLLVLGCAILMLYPSVERIVVRPYTKNMVFVSFLVAALALSGATRLLPAIEKVGAALPDYSAFRERLESIDKLFSELDSGNGSVAVDLIELIRKAIEEAGKQGLHESSSTIADLLKVESSLQRLLECLESDFLGQAKEEDPLLAEASLVSAYQGRHQFVYPGLHRAFIEAKHSIEGALI